MNVHKNLITAFQYIINVRFKQLLKKNDKGYEKILLEEKSIINCYEKSFENSDKIFFVYIIQGKAYKKKDDTGRLLKYLIILSNENIENIISSDLKSFFDIFDLVFKENRQLFSCYVSEKSSHKIIYKESILGIESGGYFDVISKFSIPDSIPDLETLQILKNYYTDFPYSLFYQAYNMQEINYIIGESAEYEKSIMDKYILVKSVNIKRNEKLESLKNKSFICYVYNDERYGTSFRIISFCSIGNNSNIKPTEAVLHNSTLLKLAFNVKKIINDQQIIIDPLSLRFSYVDLIFTEFEILNDSQIVNMLPENPDILWKKYDDIFMRVNEYLLKNKYEDSITERAWVRFNHPKTNDEIIYAWITDVTSDCKIKCTMLRSYNLTGIRIGETFYAEIINKKLYVLQPEIFYSRISQLLITKDIMLLIKDYYFFFNDVFDHILKKTHSSSNSYSWDYDGGDYESFYTSIEINSESINEKNVRKKKIQDTNAYIFTLTGTNFYNRGAYYDDCGAEDKGRSNVSVTIICCEKYIKKENLTEFLMNKKKVGEIYEYIFETGESYYKQYFPYPELFKVTYLYIERK